MDSIMADWLTQEQRTRNMASIRSRGNRTTEARFAALLRSAGIWGWRRHVSLPGKPDFIFRRARVAVFVDGCFWHGCPRCYRPPHDNHLYWKKKVLANRLRDKRATRRLRSEGWTVLRIWEHSLAGGNGRKRLTRKLMRLFSPPERRVSWRLRP